MESESFRSANLVSSNRHAIHSGEQTPHLCDQFGYLIELERGFVRFFIQSENIGDSVLGNIGIMVNPMGKVFKNIYFYLFCCYVFKKIISECRKNITVHAYDDERQGFRLPIWMYRLEKFFRYPRRIMKSTDFFIHGWLRMILFKRSDPPATDGKIYPYSSFLSANYIIT